MVTSRDGWWSPLHQITMLDARKGERCGACVVGDLVSRELARFYENVRPMTSSRLYDDVITLLCQIELGQVRAAWLQQLQVPLYTFISLCKAKCAKSHMTSRNPDFCHKVIFRSISFFPSESDSKNVCLSRGFFSVIPPDAGGAHIAQSEPVLEKTMQQRENVKSCFFLILKT